MTDYKSSSRFQRHPDSFKMAQTALKPSGSCPAWFKAFKAIRKDQRAPSRYNIYRTTAIWSCNFFIGILVDSGDPVVWVLHIPWYEVHAQCLWVVRRTTMLSRLAIHITSLSWFMQLQSRLTPCVLYTNVCYTPGTAVGLVPAYAVPSLTHTSSRGSATPFSPVRSRRFSSSAA